MIDFITQWAKSYGENFGEVDDGLYRSAYPDDGLLAHYAYGLKLATVLDLRTHGVSRTLPLPTVDGRSLSDYSGREVALFRGNLDDKGPVDVARVEAAAEVLFRGVRPILVYCQGGRHRTGGVVATYRVRYCNWSSERAFSEAREYGLYGAFGHEAWVHYILNLK